MFLFRNDDVSVETSVDNFQKFCSIFHEYGFVQLHGITTHGYTHDRPDNNLKWASYPGEEPIVDMTPEKVMKLSEEKWIGDNKKLVDFINRIPDKIALHGPYHFDYTKLDEEQQEAFIRQGLYELSLLFPKKAIRDFIPPFNRYNDATERVCRKYGLTLHSNKGEHLEAIIHHSNKYTLHQDREYRYHHHRFYDESAFAHYDLSLRRLYRFFMEVSSQRPILSRESYSECVLSCQAQPWYAYAWKNFEKLDQCYSPYYWIRENVDRDKYIVETGCGAGGVLHMLWHEGFRQLFGYDIDEKSVSAAVKISAESCSNIVFGVHNCTNKLTNGSYDVILGMNWIYLLEDFGLEQFLKVHLPCLNKNGYIIFDVIDSSFNNHPLNQYFTQDWKLPQNERRSSEYHERFSVAEVLSLAEQYSLSHIKTFDVPYIIPRKVYVFKAPH